MPGVYQQLLKSNADLEGLSNLRHGLSAGEVFAMSVREEWSDRVGKPIYEALGITECSTFISSSPTSQGRPVFLGRPQPGRRVALLPLNNGSAPAPLGDVGVISVHRSDPGLMKGYWRRPVETESVMREDWFLTGDLGVMDDDGYIVFHERSDDQMNAQGYRVAPEEVEAALMLHPQVSRAAVVELPVRENVSVIAAFLTCHEDIPVDSELTSHCAEHIATYKIPKFSKWYVSCLELRMGK